MYFFPGRRKINIYFLSVKKMYKIGPILGRGAEAIVYETIVHDITNPSGVEKKALKNFTKTERNVEQLRKSIMKEYDLVRKLHHANIIKYYDIYESDVSFCIIMEKIETINMKRIIFSHQTIKFIMIELLNGLQYLHEQNIVHGDIKLENILLSSSSLSLGTGGTGGSRTSNIYVQEPSVMSLKIIDFGLAKNLTTENARIYEIYGTANYTSPEMLMRQGISFAADIWSVGVLLYYLVMHEYPFADPNGSLEATYRNIKSLSFIKSNPNKNFFALDLINKILVYEDMRLSIDDILDHSYLQS